MEKKTYTLEEIAAVTKAQLVGDPAYAITSFADLESAERDQISFFSNPLYDHARYTQALKETKAGAIFVSPKTQLIPNRNFLLHRSPSLAFQQVVEMMLPPIRSGFEGIHATAVIHPSAKIEEGVTIGPHTVIDQSVTIRKNSRIASQVYIGPQSTIGEDCQIYSHVTIRERTTIGNRVIIQPGAVIGSCGFGYYTDERGKHHPLKQLGVVILEDEVEIGANTTIDRASFKETRIKRGTKIDNLVQIAHNVQIGEDNLIVSQTGIAGSTETGKHVVLGGQVAVNGHIKLADGVIVTARSGVSKSITEAGKYGGVPTMPLSDYNRNSVQLRNISKLISRIEALEKRPPQT